MVSGSCPRCRSLLEPGASFCHSCGMDLEAALGTPALHAAATFQTPFSPYPMFPAPGVEPPADPMSHERTLSSIAGIIILFNASIILIFAIIYLVDRSVGWEVQGSGWDTWEERVIYWDWVLASVFMMASFGAGVAGGIVSIRGTRYPLATVSAVMLLISSIIISWDFRTWGGDPFGEIAFVLVLALIPLVLLVMSRSGFATPVSRSGGGPPVYGTDNYGWASTGPEGGPEGGTGPKGVGP